MRTIKKVKINITTYIFMILLLYSGYKDMLVILSCVFLVHELGHVFFCTLFKVKIISIEIFPYGGVIKLKKLFNNPIYKDLFISLGGIFFQIIFELVNIIFIKSSLIHYYNKIFILINLLPVIPFDGSKILFCFLTKYIPYFYALKLSLILSILFTMFITIYQVFFNDFNFVFLSFVFFYALTEIKRFNYVLNQFYLERYLYDFSHKKSKYYDLVDIRLIRREKQCFFFDGFYVSEREILAKKFDNSSYF